jgi:hypothetical protein
MLACQLVKIWELRGSAHGPPHYLIPDMFRRCNHHTTPPIPSIGDPYRAQHRERIESKANIPATYIPECAAASRHMLGPRTASGVCKRQPTP